MANNNNLSQTLDTFFNQELVDCLPGIFFLYEVVDQEFYLKRWNNKHAIITGGEPHELLNAKALSFIDKAFWPHIKESIQKVLEEGSAQNVYGNIMTKTQGSLPYVFEAYRLNIDDRLYFMGTGLDISDLVSAQEQIKFLELQKKQREKELFSVALEEQKKEELLQTVLIKLESLEIQNTNSSNAKAIKDLTKEIKSNFSSTDTWQVFKRMFNEIHYNFFKGLAVKHPSLTRSELEYCAYLKIQMHTLEICKVMNISKDSLTKKRFRLKKKLGLAKQENLDLYIISF